MIDMEFGIDYGFEQYRTPEILHQPAEDEIEQLSSAISRSPAEQAILDGVDNVGAFVVALFTAGAYNNESTEAEASLSTPEITAITDVPTDEVELDPTELSQSELVAPRLGALSITDANRALDIDPLQYDLATAA